MQDDLLSRAFQRAIARAPFHHVRDARSKNSFENVPPGLGFDEVRYATHAPREHAHSDSGQLNRVLALRVAGGYLLRQACVDKMSDFDN